MVTLVLSNIFRLLKNGSSYPGKHNNATQRSSESCKPLEPKSQMLIIWKSLVEYLLDKTRNGKSVNIKRFGAFTFDISTELPKIAMRNIGAT